MESILCFSSVQPTVFLFTHIPVLRFGHPLKRLNSSTLDHGPRRNSNLSADQLYLGRIFGGRFIFGSSIFSLLLQVIIYFQKQIIPLLGYQLPTILLYPLVSSFNNRFQFIWIVINPHQLLNCILYVSKWSYPFIISRAYCLPFGKTDS